MKYNLLSLLFVIILGLASPLALAQEEGTSSFPAAKIIVVLDVDEAITSTNLWQDYKAYENELNNTYRDAVSSAQNQLIAERDDLQSQRSLLSDEAFQEKESEYNQKVLLIQRQTQQEKKKIDEELLRVQGQVRQLFSGVVIELAQEENIDLILRKSANNVAVILSRDALDITQAVIDKMNGKDYSISFTKTTNDNQASGQQNN